MISLSYCKIYNQFFKLVNRIIARARIKLARPAISDVGAYGSEISTPNIDRLAADGMRFTDFYNTPRCCPTRASLLTGLYPQQTGVGWLVDQPVQPGNYTRRLNDSCVTIAEALRSAGYQTILSGKWHVGEDEAAARKTAVSSILLPLLTL